MITEGRAVVRRRAGREGLDARLLARLVAARLVTAGQDSVEISHEALLSNWPRLAGWLAESRSAILLRQRLDEAAQAWSDAGEDPDLLYRGAQLAAAAEWAATRSDLSPLEQRFVRAGTAAAEAAETDRARATRRLRRLVAGLAGTLVLVLVATAVAVWQAREVGRREVAARSRQYAAQALATGVDGQRARRLALQAWQSGHTREARGALASAQMTNLVGRLGSAVGGTTVAVGPDGTRVAVGHGDGTLQLWDATTLRPIGRRTPTGLSRQVVSAGFSSDGRLLATGTLPGTVAEADRGTVVWDAASGERLRQVPGVGFVGWRAGHLLSVYLDSRASSFAVGEWDPRTGRRVSSIVLHTLLPPYGLAVSPDAALVAVPGSDGVTRVWRLADGKLVATTGTPRPEAPTDAVFAADGSLVTSDTDGSLRVWAMPSGRPLRRLFSHEERGTSRLTATTDGVVYAAGSGDTIESWYVPGGEPVTNRLIGFTGTIQRVAVSADGALTVATGTDGVTTVWRRGDWLSHDRAVLDARFDPTGRLLATGDAGGTLRIWDSRTGTLVASHHYPGAVRALDYAPDGTLAVGVADGTVHLRDARGQDRTVLTLGGSLAPGDVRFSPDGTLLATGASTGAGADDHGVVVVWDVPGGRERERLDTGAEEPFGLTFSTHGDLLIAATTQQTLRPDRTYRKQSIIHTWRTSDLGVVGSYTAGQEQVTAIAAGPDGHTLAVAGTSNQVQFRSISDGHLTGAPLQHGSAVRVVTYAPDGRTLATATTADPTIRLWDTRTGGLLAELSGHLSGANSLAFSPDGRMLASGDPDQTVGLWHIEPADAVDRLCRQLRTVTLAGAAQPEACR